MSNWSGGIMTAAGRALQAKVEAGTKLELTHVKLGDGTETGDAVDELTDLVGGKAVLGISSTTVKDSLCTVTSVILTENVSTGFWAREWGLFAKDPDEGEILYMISLDPNPEFVPPSTAAVKQSATYAMSIAVSNAANIAVKIDPEGLTTNEMLAAAACLVERDKAYTVGERLYTPTLRRGLLLQCTKAGTTADTMLDCSTAELSDTITDGGVTWTVVKYALTTDVPPLASALATPRKIELTGNVTGSADFDGSKNIQIATSLADVSALAHSLLSKTTAADMRGVIEANAQNCGGIVAESLTEPGYVKFANGFIIEWGVVSVDHAPGTDNIQTYHRWWAYPIKMSVPIGQLATDISGNFPDPQPFCTWAINDPYGFTVNCRIARRAFVIAIGIA